MKHEATSCAAGAALLLAVLLAGPSCGEKPAYVPENDRGTEKKTGSIFDAGRKKPTEQQRLYIPQYASTDDPENDRFEMREREFEAYRIIRAFGVAQRAFLYEKPKPSPAVDLDADGQGEYAYLWELCGLSNIRTPGGKDKPSTLDVADWRWFMGKDKEDRPVWWKVPFGRNEPVYFEKQDGYEFLVHKANAGKVHMINSKGIAERAGYLFAFYLPGKDKALNAGLEVPGGDPTLADAMERRFCAYAWPREYNVTGRRAFFVCMPEKVFATWNVKAQYSGYDRAPLPEAGFDRDGPNPKNLEARPAAVDPSLEVQGLTSCDGEKWKLYGETKGVKRKFEWDWTKEEEIADFLADGGEKQRWFEGEEKKKPGKKPADEEDQGQGGPGEDGAGGGGNGAGEDRG